jgi:hypothetical protein
MTNKTDKPVAKSLHTITVIVQVARMHLSGRELTAGNKDIAITVALNILGLAGRADPYGLAAIARKQLG